VRNGTRSKTVPAARASGSGLIRVNECDGVLAGMIGLKKTDWRYRATAIGYRAAPGV
jgi:hypothetical protein